MNVRGATRKHKVFAGVALSEAVRERIRAFAGELERAGFDAQYGAKEKYHATLAYLGWIDPTLLIAVQAQMRVAASTMKPFVMTIDSIGAFPDERRPQVVWAGSRGGSAEFSKLCARTRECVGSLGFTFEKDAVAHITLARVKTAARPLPVIDGLLPVEVPVEAITLFESVPGKQTTRYEQVVSFSLGALDD